MATKVFALDTKPGIQRDGTVFDKQFYNDGRWVRFQRGRPRKMGGYREISGEVSGPSRGIWVNPQNGINQIYSGYSDGLQELIIDNNGVGGGVTDITLTSFTPSPLNMWQFDGFYDVSGSGVGTIVAHPGQNLAQIDSTTDTPVLIGDINGTTLGKIGVFQNAGAILNSTVNVSFQDNDIQIGAGQTVTGTGIPASTTVVSVVLDAPNLATTSVTGTAGQMSCASTSGLFVGQAVTVSGTLTGTATGIVTGTTYYIISTNYSTTFTLSATPGGSAIVTTAGTTTGLIFTLGQYTKVTLSNAATANGSSTLTFDNNVAVSGGVVVLHPYIFVFGNNGLIKNCSAGNAQDWVSADANETNAATGKIVQGLPVRGGSNSPSGLFWSLDSLVRVSYSPQTLGVPGTNNTITKYWRYDIVSSQSSILSSQSVIEYDGIYYWCGVDRFLMYNGVVKEIPNSMNQNWFFDNLNYQQRQKVWVTKVPRYGEIWWFYPRGSATECTDAIIYNVRENTWYDAGSASGARRSAGYFSQVFRYPINAGWEVSESVPIFSESMTYTSGLTEIRLDTYNPQIRVGLEVTGVDIPANTYVTGLEASGVKTLGAVTTGSGYVDGTYTDVALTGGHGGSATADFVVTGGVVTSVTLVYAGSGYWVGDSLGVNNVDLGGSGAGFAVAVSAIWTQQFYISNAPTSSNTATLTFSTPAGYISIFQHEIGTDQIIGQVQNAIESYIETNDLGWVSGGPSEPAMVGQNNWVHLDRLEPDFVQSGPMELYVTGRPFADEQDATSGPYTFQPGSGKIDLREQRREMRLIFKSNVQGGDFQMGRVIVEADISDVRGYSGS